MSGNCYAVLFNNGVCKLGRSENIASRISSHVKSGESMGLSVELIVITQSVENEKILELKLLSKFKGESNTRGVEYFENIEKDMVINAFMDLGVVFYPIKEIKSVNASGIVCTIPNGFIRGGDESKYIDELQLISLKTKIKEFLSASNLTTGLITNRLRRKSKTMVLKALSELERCGAIACDKHIHPTKKIEIATWHLIDK